MVLFSEWRIMLMQKMLLIDNDELIIQASLCAEAESYIVKG